MEGVKGTVFDIDGVLECHGRTCPGAVETITALRDKGLVLRFLTNSTLKSRALCAEKLRQAGFPLADTDVVTASYATALYLKNLQPASCWIMLEREGLDESQDIPQDAVRPDYVVMFVMGGVRSV